MCKETFTSRPIVLICCNTTVCEHHFDEKLSRNVFTCSLCNKVHDMDNVAKFAPNKTVEKLLEIEFDKCVNLGDIYVQTNREVKKLERSFVKITELIKDPKNYIFEHVSDLKREIDLRKATIIEKIDVICEEMTQKLDIYQKECYENIEKIKLENTHADTLKKVQTHLDEWTKDNRRVLLVSDDTKRREIRSKSIDLDTKLFTGLKELKENLLMNKVWTYVGNKRMIEKFETELIQFEA
jgi:hypothetical protein